MSKHILKTPLYWSQEDYQKWVDMGEDFKNKHGRKPAIHTMREPWYLYHFNVVCAMVKKFKGDQIDVLEVGSYMGESSKVLSEYFKSVTCVDPYGIDNQVSEVDTSIVTEKFVSDSVDEEVKFSEENDLIHHYFLNNFVANHENVTFHRMTSDDFFETTDQKFDFIYIDGDHRYDQQVRDFTNALKCLKEDGILAGHDYPWESTKKAIGKLGLQDKPMITFMEDTFMCIPENLL